MISIDLIVGRICSAASILGDPFSVDGRSLVDIYRDASKGDINLSIDTHAMSGELTPGRLLVQSLDLHEAIELLTGNPRKSNKVNRIGLVFAGKFKPKESTLGVMFDWGTKRFAFDERQDTTAFQGVPREGCAIFVDRIRELRQDDDEFVSQMAYTIVHELGHVFNLQHAKDGRKSFMCSSTNRVYNSSDGMFQFDQVEENFLANCSSSPHVWPGGCNFTDQGTLMASDDVATDGSSSFGLSMKIDIQPREFWFFEPIELDVEIATKPGVNKVFRIPDTIDTGYDNFDIWIRDPTGQVRKFLSPRYYCWSGSQCVIQKGKPFSRDISLFAESGGYTFTKAGRHEIWTTFRISSHRFLQSNVVSIYVKPSEPRNPHYQEFYKQLTTPSHAKLLYFRRPSKSRQELTRLREFAVSCRSTHIKYAVLYALGRAEAEALSTTVSHKRIKELALSAQELLHTVVECQSISRHRKRKAAEVLQTLVATYL